MELLSCWIVWLQNIATTSRFGRKSRTDSGQAPETVYQL